MIWIYNLLYTRNRFDLSYNFYIVIPPCLSSRSLFLESHRKLVDRELYVRRGGLTSFMVACACERAASLSAKLAARLRLRSASSLAALRRLQRSLSLSLSRSSDGMPAPCCWRRPRVASFSRIRCNQRSKGPCPGSNSAHKTFTVACIFENAEEKAIKWRRKFNYLRKRKSTFLLSRNALYFNPVNIWTPCLTMSVSTLQNQHCKTFAKWINN